MDTLLLRVFQKQIQFQCEALLTSSRQLDDALKARNSRQVFMAVQSLMTAASNISKALWGEGGRHEARRKPLRESIQVTENSPFFPAVFRSSFEHFDERLEAWWAESAGHNYVDMTLGPGKLIPSGKAGRQDTFRHFDPSSRDLTLWGDLFNVRDLVAEAERLHPLVQSEASRLAW